MTDDNPVTEAPASPSESAEMFSPVTPGRISREIVQQIKWAIRDRRLRPGDRLPPERELSERFRASRVSVRDALRVLEAGGLIEIRVGARGGAFVRAPAPGIVGEGIANMLTLSAVSPEEVTEARAIFELGMIPLVCERANDEDIAALVEVCDRSEEALERGPYPVELSAEFHVRLARSAHNAAVEMLVDSFHDALLMSLMRAKEVAPEMGGRGVAEHRDVVSAIEARDPGRAQHIMATHLARTADRLGLAALADRLKRTSPSSGK
jgi:GntR family transcriptional regulator, transcriptional repressor for pyruvate dehydrogenase complex